MKKLLLFPLLSALLFSCSNDPSNNASEDSPKEHVPVITKVMIDSISKVQWTRFKHIAHGTSTIKLGKSTMNLVLENARINLEGALDLKDGWWLLKDSVFEGGVINIHMSSIAAVQVNDENRLELRSPDYLDVEKYPYATIEVKSITARNDSSIVKANITIKDTTAAIEFPAKVEWGKNKAPVKFEGKFTIDGKAWKLFKSRPGQEIAEDRFDFICSFTTK